jgi:hypothetical protein
MSRQTKKKGRYPPVLSLSSHMALPLHLPTVLFFTQIFQRLIAAAVGRYLQQAKTRFLDLATAKSASLGTVPVARVDYRAVSLFSAFSSFFSHLAYLPC